MFLKLTSVCLLAQSDAGQRCPVDNEMLSKEQLFPDNFAKREILSLTVRCSNPGCTSKMELRHLEVRIQLNNVIVFWCPWWMTDFLLQDQINSEVIVSLSPESFGTLWVCHCALSTLPAVCEKDPFGGPYIGWVQKETCVMSWLCRKFCLRGEGGNIGSWIGKWHSCCISCKQIS